MQRFFLFIFLFICAIAVPGNAQAQDPQEVRLTIRVVDSSTGAGVANAVLYIAGSENELIDAPDTDATGLSSAMVSRSSSFVIMAGTPGYPVAHFVVAVGQEPLTVTIPLVAAATIVGHVVDADTKKPMAGVPVQVLPLEFVRGMPQVGTGLATETDADGRFEARNLPAGDYIVETDAPRGVPDSGPAYGWQVWPGGRGFADAAPLSVASGATIDFGTIAIAKRVLATVGFRVVGDCAGRFYYVRLVQTFAKSAMNRAQEPSLECGRTGSFAQVPPGSYGLVATSVASSGDTADAWIGVTNSDIVVDLPLRSTPVATIRGRVVTGTGDTQQSVTGVTVGFLSGAEGGGLVAGLSLASEGAKAGADGSFEQQVFVPLGGKVAVQVEGLPANLYVDSLRYNGTRMGGDEFAMNEFVPTQELDIICSDRFGVVSGEVAGEGHGLVDVLFVPWPNDGANYPSGVREAHAGPDGSFSLSPVRPGRYRAVAVRSGDRAKFEAPFRLMRTLPNALDVDVAAGAGNSVRIEKIEE